MKSILSLRFSSFWIFHSNLGLSLQLPIEISTFAPYYSVEISALSSLLLISSTNITFFALCMANYFMHGLLMLLTCPMTLIVIEVCFP